MSRITIIAAMLFSAGLIVVNAGPSDAAAVKIKKGNVIIQSDATGTTSAQGRIKAGVKAVKGQGQTTGSHRSGKRVNYDTTGRKKLTVRVPSTTSTVSAQGQIKAGVKTKAEKKALQGKK